MSPSLTKRHSDILQQVVQHIIKEESSGDSPNKEGIVKFAFADVDAPWDLKDFLKQTLQK